MEDPQEPMTTEHPTPPEGSQALDLAVQVANIAAQVSVALRSPGSEKRNELEGRLALAQERLGEQGSPEGLIPFLEVMRQLLQGRDPSELVEELPRAYRAVYDQLIDEQTAEQDQGDLTVGEVIEEVSANLVRVMRHGTADQRRMMGNMLLQMAQDAESRPDLAVLIDFFTAARCLLQDRDPSPSADKLHGPFRAQWERVIAAIQE
jgi:hypothetical protein